MVVEVLPPVMVVFTTLPKPVTASVAPLAEEMLFTLVKPVTPVKSKVDGLGEAVKFSVSMLTKEVADCVGPVPETVAFNVSVPVPPLTTSPAPHVPAAAVNVSSPALPVDVCVADVSVKAGLAVETVAKLPPETPVVCEKVKDVATFALNVVAEAPNVTSAVICE